jgi:hypothetical protein
MAVAVHVSVPSAFAGRRKLIFISVLAEKTLRSRLAVMLDAVMAESANAAMIPPWITPTGLAKRASAGISHTVTPGVDLSTHAKPKVMSQLGGICTRPLSSALDTPSP